MTYPHSQNPEQTASFNTVDVSCQLFKCTRSLAIPNTQPQVYEFVHRLVDMADPVMQDMENNIEQLKDVFLDAIYKLFEREDISKELRIIIGFNSDGELEVFDTEHPQAEKINALLAQAPNLAEALKQIALDTYVIKNIQSLGQAISYNEEYQSSARNLVNNYQVCFKGALSHFYYI